MITGYQNKKLMLNTPLRGREAGAVVRIKTDKGGMPVDGYWRRRLNDAKIDGCVEFVEGTKVPEQASSDPGTRNSKKTNKAEDK